MAKKYRPPRLPGDFACRQAGEELTTTFATTFAMQCTMRLGKRRLPVTISRGSQHPLLGLFELTPRSMLAEAICNSSPKLVPGRVVSFEWCGTQFGVRIAGRSRYFGLFVHATDVLLAMMQAMPMDDASANRGPSAGPVTKPADPLFS